MERVVNKQIRQGVVISAKMNKTRVVVGQMVTHHRLYGKTIRRHKKYYVHDEKNISQVGDYVEIVSSRPLSRLKRWQLRKVIKKGNI